MRGAAPYKTRRIIRVGKPRNSRDTAIRFCKKLKKKKNDAHARPPRPRVTRDPQRFGSRGGGGSVSRRRAGNSGKIPSPHCDRSHGDKFNWRFPIDRWRAIERAKSYCFRANPRALLQHVNVMVYYSVVCVCVYANFFMHKAPENTIRTCVCMRSLRARRFLGHDFEMSRKAYGFNAIECYLCFSIYVFLKERENAGNNAVEACVIFTRV